MYQYSTPIIEKRINHGSIFEEHSRATYLAEKQVQAYWSSKQKGMFGINFLLATESQLIEYEEYLIDNTFTRIKSIKKCKEMYG